ncbi:MAG: hypothetical protein IJ809_00580 [Clostridia bacterium]|nr:hypothetical protein [Clostridia bacterium]
MYKKVIKFQDGIDKISKGKLANEDSIETMVSGFSFVFNMFKNKNQYKKDLSKGMQFALWQTVIEIGGKYADFPISARFLKHSLEEKPENLLITEGKAVEEILKDNYFKENIKNIVKKYGENNKEFVFDSNIDKAFPMQFYDKDLYFAMNQVELYIEDKKVDSKWNLDIKVHDRYDYTEFKTPDKYYNDTSSFAKSLFSSTLYNLAFFQLLVVL